MFLPMLTPRFLSLGLSLGAYFFIGFITVKAEQINSGAVHKQNASLGLQEDRGGNLGLKGTKSLDSLLYTLGDQWDQNKLPGKHLIPYLSGFDSNTPKMSSVGQKLNNGFPQLNFDLQKELLPKKKSIFRGQDSVAFTRLANMGTFSAMGNESPRTYDSFDPLELVFDESAERFSLGLFMRGFVGASSELQNSKELKKEFPDFFTPDKASPPLVGLAQFKSSIPSKPAYLDPAEILSEVLGVNLSSTKNLSGSDPRVIAKADREIAQKFQMMIQTALKNPSSEAASRIFPPHLNAKSQKIFEKRSTNLPLTSQDLKLEKELQAQSLAFVEKRISDLIKKKMIDAVLTQSQEKASAKQEPAQTRRSGGDWWKPAAEMSTHANNTLPKNHLSQAPSTNTQSVKNESQSKGLSPYIARPISQKDEVVLSDGSSTRQSNQSDLLMPGQGEQSSPPDAQETEKEALDSFVLSSCLKETFNVMLPDLEQKYSEANDYSSASMEYQKQALTCFDLHASSFKSQRFKQFVKYDSSATGGMTIDRASFGAFLQNMFWQKLLDERMFAATMPKPSNIQPRDFANHLTNAILQLDHANSNKEQTEFSYNPELGSVGFDPTHPKYFSFIGSQSKKIKDKYGVFVDDVECQKFLDAPPKNKDTAPVSYAMQPNVNACPALRFDDPKFFENSDEFLSDPEALAFVYVMLTHPPMQNSRDNMQFAHLIAVLEAKRREKFLDSAPVSKQNGAVDVSKYATHPSMLALTNPNSEFMSEVLDKVCAYLPVSCEESRQSQPMWREEISGQLQSAATRAQRVMQFHISKDKHTDIMPSLFMENSAGVGPDGKPLIDYTFHGPFMVGGTAFVIDAQYLGRADGRRSKVRAYSEVQMHQEVGSILDQIRLAQSEFQELTQGQLKYSKVLFEGLANRLDYLVFSRSERNKLGLLSKDPEYEKLTTDEKKLFDSYKKIETLRDHLTSNLAEKYGLWMPLTGDYAYGEREVKQLNKKGNGVELVKRKYIPACEKQVNVPFPHTSNSNVDVYRHYARCLDFESSHHDAGVAQSLDQVNKFYGQMNKDIKWTLAGLALYPLGGAVMGASTRAASAGIRGGWGRLGQHIAGNASRAANWAWKMNAPMKFTTRASFNAAARNSATGVVRGSFKSPGFASRWLHASSPVLMGQGIMKGFQGIQMGVDHMRGRSDGTGLVDSVTQLALSGNNLYDIDEDGEFHAGPLMFLGGIMVGMDGAAVFIKQMARSYGSGLSAGARQSLRTYLSQPASLRSPEILKSIKAAHRRGEWLKKDLASTQLGNILPDLGALTPYFWWDSARMRAASDEVIQSNIDELEILLAENKKSGNLAEAQKIEKSIAESKQKLSTWGDAGLEASLDLAMAFAFRNAKPGVIFENNNMYQSLKDGLMLYQGEVDAAVKRALLGRPQANFTAAEFKKLQSELAALKTRHQKTIDAANVALPKDGMGRLFYAPVEVKANRQNKTFEVSVNEGGWMRFFDAKIESNLVNAALQQRKALRDAR